VCACDEPRGRAPSAAPAGEEPEDGDGPSEPLESHVGGDEGRGSVEGTTPAVAEPGAGTIATETATSTTGEARTAAKAASKPTRRVTFLQEAGAPRAEGEEAVRRVGPEDERRHADVLITRGTLFGNPFEMRGEGERDAVCDAYCELLTTCGDCHKIARHHGRGGGRLAVHASSGKTRPHVRLEALRRLAQRARKGESLRLRCTCPRANRCHGDEIVAWVAARM
jgi:hypothetical protein